MGNGADVLVIGGGPAGLAAAIAARRKGFDVTVADGAKPPIDKACGEGLLPDTLRALRELGVTIHPGDGKAFPGIRFVDTTTSVEGRFPSISGLGMRRTLLHEKMIARAEECGVCLLWNTPVTGVTQEGAILGGQMMPATWIVGADGINSKVRRWAGLESGSRREVRFAQTRHIRVKPWTDYVEVHWGRKMQAYVTPVGREEFCFALVSRDPRMRIEEAWAEFPRLADLLVNSEPSNADRGAITATRRLDRVFKGKIALIGDASGSIDAITGDGLCQSFRQALSLADALISGVLKSYQTAHRRMAWRPNLMGHLLLRLDQYSSVRKRAMRALAKAPDLFSRLLAIQAGEASTLHSLRTSALLGWQLLAA
ncbi:MAG TPA: FAD-dependent monooxygenase [Candidatus Acidoferrum sp.]|nr:FAD-dependent monooxygenase [Candidatus Acidoferrum sp.]